MSEITDVIGEITDVASELIPSEISTIIKLAKLAFKTFGEENNDLNTLYKRAFKEAVENLIKFEKNAKTCELLENCKEIHNYEDVSNLFVYVNKINEEHSLLIQESEIKEITYRIARQFEIILFDEKYSKLYKQFIVCNKLDDLENDIKEIKEEIIEFINNKENQYKTDNKSYERDFVKPLFRHRERTVVSLKDVFIKPYLTINGSKKRYDAITAIQDFVQTDGCGVFFIEGFGGYGKSSIASFLAYNHTFNSASKDISFLNNRQLIIIRLRDVEGEDKISTIKKNLKNNDYIENDAVLIFDGLDELCMIEKKNGSTIAKEIMKEFSFYPRKIIITTRPTYINYTNLKNNLKSLNIKFKIAEICCFDEDQITNFATNFAKYDKSHIGVLEYVKNLPLEKKENKSIYGSPFLLYLILSGGIKEEEKDNSWLLMHRLFHDELFNPPYGNDRDVDEDMAEIIYQFNCDIAYEIFKTQNKKLSMTSNELKKIFHNDDVKDIVEKSHGLFSYMRKSDSGAVEFVHNHIRDYFLCEKVFREINTWYSTDEIDGYEIAQNLGKLLKYFYFTDETKLFIKEALQSNVYTNIIEKCEKEPLSNIFDWFYESDGVVEYNVKESNGLSYKEISYYVIDNSAYIYRTIYDLKNRENEKIYWISEKAINGIISNSDNSFLFTGQSRKNLVYDALKSYFKNAFLSNANLSYMDLSFVDLRGANLYEANLFKAELTGADLRGADLTKASLHEVDLNGANLSGADLSSAYLNGADLSFSENISEAIFYMTEYDDITKFPDGFDHSEPKFVKNEFDDFEDDDFDDIIDINDSTNGSLDT